MAARAAAGQAAVKPKGGLSDDQVCVRNRLSVGEKRKYLEWVRSVADTLQAPGELKRLASYDNVFSATPHRVVEFTFDSLEDAARYFGRKEVSVIFQGELPAHGTNIHINVLALCGDYVKDTVAGQGVSEDES
jgi:hypothetical protein